MEKKDKKRESFFGTPKETLPSHKSVIFATEDLDDAKQALIQRDIKVKEDDLERLKKQLVCKHLSFKFERFSRVSGDYLLTCRDCEKMVSVPVDLYNQLCSLKGVDIDSE